MGLVFSLALKLERWEKEPGAVPFLFGLAIVHLVLALARMFYNDFWLKCKIGCTTFLDITTIPLALVIIDVLFMEISAFCKKFPMLERVFWVF